MKQFDWFDVAINQLILTLVSIIVIIFVFIKISRENLKGKCAYNQAAETRQLAIIYIFNKINVDIGRYFLGFKICEIIYFNFIKT